MSDSIINLPTNEYSNPTKEEIQILDTLFPKQTTIVELKISILASLLYIIFIFIHKKFNKSSLLLPLTTIIMFACMYYIQLYVIR